MSTNEAYLSILELKFMTSETLSSSCLSLTVFADLSSLMILITIFSNLLVYVTQSYCLSC